MSTILESQSALRDLLSMWPTNAFSLYTRWICNTGHCGYKYRFLVSHVSPFHAPQRTAGLHIHWIKLQPTDTFTLESYDYGNKTVQHGNVLNSLLFIYFSLIDWNTRFILIFHYSSSLIADLLNADLSFVNKRARVERK